MEAKQVLCYHIAGIGVNGLGEKKLHGDKSSPYWAWHGDQAERRNQSECLGSTLWAARRADAGQFDQIDVGTFTRSKRRSRIRNLRNGSAKSVRASHNQLR